MTPYEKEQLEKAAKEVLAMESEMNTWITRIKAAQDKCSFIRQKIYNTLNHDKIKDAED